MYEKKSIKFIIAAALISSLLFITACAPPRYETITSKAGNYEYPLGETVSIIDVETNDTIAELTITSCEITKDEPFYIDKSYEYYDKNLEETVEVEKKEYYSELYIIRYEFNDYVEYVNNASTHFDSENSNFVINPYDDYMHPGILFVGKKQKCGLTDGIPSIPLSFTYDKRQERHTALFRIDITNCKKS